MIPRTATFCFVLLAAVGARAGEPVAVLPSATDARITAFDAPHLVWLPEGRARNQLLVFLPGTGGTPEKALFHPFAATAARLGYHVVALMYPDNLASQKKCGESADPDAYVKFRLAIIRGGAIGPHRTVASYDSIESRARARALHRRRPRPSAEVSPRRLERTPARQPPGLNLPAHRAHRVNAAPVPF